MDARVIAVDPLPERRELARQLGAAVAIDSAREATVETIRELTHGEGANATLDHRLAVGGLVGGDRAGLVSQHHRLHAVA
jgi:threonine dehydrogenase-like Zn-dependent dehydrogenase